MGIEQPQSFQSQQPRIVTAARFAATTLQSTNIMISGSTRQELTSGCTKRRVKGCCCLADIANECPVLDLADDGI